MEWAFAFVPGGTFLLSKAVLRSSSRAISQDLLALIESVLLGILAFAVLQTTRPSVVGPVKSEFVQTTANVVLQMVAIGIFVMKCFLQGPTLWDLFQLVTQIFVALQTNTTTAYLTLSWLLVSIGIWNVQSVLQDLGMTHNARGLLQKSGIAA